MGSANEWKKYKDEYMLYKIEQIAVTIYPNDALDNEPTYINLDWLRTSTEVTADGIKYSDSTKIVYNELKKPKTFFFKPPNLIVNGIQLRKFNRTNNIPTAALYFYQTSGALRGRVDVRVVFKVPTEYANHNKIQLKKVEDLARLDEGNMIDDNLRIVNNSRLAGVHQESFSLIPGEEEEKEEEKLEGDDENEKGRVITEEDSKWSLFEQLVKEDEEAKLKKKEKNKRRRKNKKEKKKKMIEKIKNNKLYRKLFKKQLDNFNKELKSTALLELEYDREKRQAKEKAINKRKNLGKERKLRKEQQFEEEPNKVIDKRKQIREIKRWLMDRYKQLTTFLEQKDVPTNFINTHDTSDSKYIEEQQNIHKIMQHIKSGKLNKRDLRYLDENLNKNSYLKQKSYDLDSIFNH
jgi:hypothetical protein